jgi:hypothetical protein
MAQAQLDTTKMHEIISWLNHTPGQPDHPVLVNVHGNASDTTGTSPTMGDTSISPSDIPLSPTDISALTTPLDQPDTSPALRQQYYRTRDAPVVIKKAKNVNIWLNAPPQGTVSIANVTNNS